MAEAALYEQLAEEAAELAQAALKYARILRGENPTPVTVEEAGKCVTEEFTDITLCAAVLGLAPDEELLGYKYRRWRKRLKEAGIDYGFMDFPDGHSISAHSSAAPGLCSND